MLFASSPQLEASGCVANEPIKQIIRNLVLLMGCSATAFAQNAVEYGVLAAKSS